MKLDVGKDESQSRIDANSILSIIESHQWVFDKTQTSIVAKRNEDEEIQRTLQVKRQWIVQQFHSLNNQIHSLVGNHWPTFADSTTVYNWSQLQVAEIINQCKMLLQNNHPSIQITAAMVTELAAKVISLTIQRDHMIQMLNNINRWINETPEYRHKYQNSFNSILDGLKDDSDTETTTVTPQQGINGYEQLKLFADQVTHHLQSKRQRNLQRYNIRKMVEKSLTPVTPTQNKENKQTKSKKQTNELEL